MLQLVDIRKEYRTGQLVQKALDGVSLNFRDNEFVAILGPSGSGKTTLLNIIGGLDRYDSGDLIINNISTKKYRDKDWDSYRNHTIGFVFQSYNLIPHQSILANVELALTIGGISGKERKDRAKQALEKVGLGDQIHKLPSQMSGGQMQRVAIARALVNDPDILLADEPTGALDSDTSVQVMDLLREVASDRLVIMVTHNPELAHSYATRIVELKDGQIRSDSDPFKIDPDTAAAAPIHKNMGRSSMSFLTALMLSLNNLLTKKARTILVAFAGSIGIIGIALILSMSNGANKYIADIEEDTLSEYPMEITSTSFSLASMMEGRSSSDSEEEEREDVVKEIKTITRLLSRMSSNDLASLKKYIDSGESGVEEYAKSIRYSYNVIPLVFHKDGDTYDQVNPYKVLSPFDNGMSSIYSSMTSFSMSMTDIFHEMPEDNRLYIEQYDVKAGRWPEGYNECVLVLTSGGMVSDLALYAMGLEDDSTLDEAVKNYMNGGELSFEDNRERGIFEYEDFIGITFKLVNACDCYTYDSQYKVWTSKTDNVDYMNRLCESSEDLTIVGVVMPKEDANITMLNTGLNYTYGLTEHIIASAAESGIVKAQLDDPETDVLTGEPFGEKSEDSFDMSELFSIDEDKIRDAFKFDEDALSSAASDLSFDGINMDLSGLTDPSLFDGAIPDLSSMDLEKLLKNVNINITEENINEAAGQLTDSYREYIKSHPESDITLFGNSAYEFLRSDEAIAIISNDVRAAMADNETQLVTNEDLQGLTAALVSGFESWSQAHDATDLSNYSEYFAQYLNSEEALGIMTGFMNTILQRAAQDGLTQEDLTKIAQDLAAAYDVYSAANGEPTIEDITEGLLQFMSSDDARSVIVDSLMKNVDTTDLEKELSQNISSLTSQFTGSFGNIIAGVMGQAMSQAAASIQDTIVSYMESLSSKLQDAFSFDPDAFAGAITMNMDQREMEDLLSSMLSNSVSTYDQNLKSFGYAELAKPNEILIYPKDFESKDALVLILDGYNTDMKDSGQEEKVITYTDIVGTMMSSVTTIVNAISYILIAFVSISLIVSSIMIGVITYISVLERRKEIGILRSIGASKRNISSVFNAETIITGFLAGILGVGISLLLLIPANAILRALTGQQNLAAFLQPQAAVILIVLSIVLTLIGGLIPSRKAANSDPVTALREV
ncbi:MAG: ABC transporter ATP-binding protein/permease [Lachnospiraceae bacterium]|nr:ABC transporter ATP-binding protein/permease [Lachnospiraceae bacterium]